MPAKKNVAVIVAHPDDEALGAGGTIARHVSIGDSVNVLFMTDGVGARGSDDGAYDRWQAALVALDILGVSHERVKALDFPDNAIDSLPLLDVVKAIETHFQAASPHIIYTHHHGDLNIDHRIVHQAVMTAFRPLPGLSVYDIYAMEVLSSTEWSPEFVFKPNVYVDVNEFMDKKIKALEAYEAEMRPSPHPRSVEAVRALATLRGSQSGLQNAEAFCLVRKVAKGSS